MTIDELIEKTSEYNIIITQEMKGQLDRYAVLLQETNKHMNLTAIDEYEEIVEKHFLDSLLPLSNLEINGTICDVGSGAGFPGLVWAIAKPEWQMTLLEPTRKRCDFLESVIQSLSLKNVTVVNQRAEDFVKEKREFFDCVTARAVANLSILSELCIPLLKKDGIFVAMKGAKGEEELHQAKHALEELGVTLQKEEDTSLSTGDKRINYYFRKVKNTSMKYPRNYGQIKKKPL